MYWEKIDDTWHVRDFLGIRKINPNEPVNHVSYYEAEAYCKWAGKRLPTEAEWEKAACWNEEKQQKSIFPWGNDSPTVKNCNLLESYHWGCTEVGTYPDGASQSGCQQMMGDVWEWTSSEYTGYPGFKSGFDEYNDKWFTNQKVLRGGSFGTPTMSIRGSYRNFFRPDERWLFSGFRCAEDI
jgi:formylglycine-generating enzyme required for sulfatase activity